MPAIDAPSVAADGCAARRGRRSHAAVSMARSRRRTGHHRDVAHRSCRSGRGTGRLHRWSAPPTGGRSAASPALRRRPARPKPQKDRGARGDSDEPSQPRRARSCSVAASPTEQPALLVEPAVQVQALEQELDRRRDRRRRAPRRPAGRRRRSQARRLAHPADVVAGGHRLAGLDHEPRSRTPPRPRPGRRCRRVRAKTSWMARASRRSTTRSSGDLVAERLELDLADRSREERPQVADARRGARLAEAHGALARALATSVSRLAMLTRTLTPERWLTSGERRASCDSSATSSSMKSGSSTLRRRRRRRSGVRSWRMIAISSSMRARVVGPDLRPEAVLERRDDASAAGVVLGVGAGDHEQVERQAQGVAAHLDVALLEHVEQARPGCARRGRAAR